jgi:hypothetical protein
MSSVQINVEASPARGVAKIGTFWPDLVAMALLTFLPTSLAIFNAYWAFTPTQAGWIDPWLYTSYFLHLKTQLLAFPTAYYGDRLSDTIPGWALYHLFGPWVGNYVFKLSLIYTALFAMYFTISRLFDRRVALFSGLLICAQPYFLTAFGWDYVDGIGITYCSLAILFTFRAAQSKRYKLSLFLAGVFCNFLITSHFLWLNLVWIIPLGYLWANQLGSRHSIWKSAAIFALGFLTAFAAFCGIYYGLTGRWFYLANNLSHTLNGFGAAQKVNAPLSSWLKWSIWMAQYNAIILIALWLLFRKGIERQQRLCLFLFVVAYATIWGWQAVQFPFVMLSFYTSFLFPFYALALGVICHHGLNGLTDRAYGLVIGLCLAINSILYLLADTWYRIGPMLQYSGSWLYGHEMITLSVVLLIATIPVCVSYLNRSWTLSILLTGVLIVYAAQLTLRPRQGWFTGSGEFTNKEGFRLVLDADAWITQRQPDRKLLWWSDQREPRQGILFGVTSLYLWGWSLLNQTLPELPLKDAEKLSVQPTVLALSWNPASINGAREALAADGFSVVTEDTATIRNGALALNLGLFRLRRVRSLVDDLANKEGLREIPTVLQVSQIVPTSKDTSSENNGFCHLTARAPRWAYLAYLPLQLPEKAEEVWIRLTVKVVKGQIAFGILNGKETNFYEREFLNPDDELQDVLLDVRHPDESRKLIIENGDWGEKESEVIVQKITVLTRPDSPAWSAVKQNQATRKTKANAGR